MLELEIRDNVVIAQVKHHFSQDDVHEIIELVESDAARAVLLDLKQYEKILQSAVIGMVISLHRDLKEIGVPVGLCSMHKHNVNVFEMAGLDNLIEIYDSLEAGFAGVAGD